MDDFLVCPLCIHFEPEYPDDYFVVTRCGHYFHNGCILEFLALGRFGCPTCDQLISPKKLTRLYGILNDNNSSTSNLIRSQQNLRLEFAPEKPSNVHDYSFKLVLLGNSGVGKTCLLRRFSENVFCSSINATRGVDLVRKGVQFNNQNVQLIIWDSLGQEQFKSIISSCMRDIQGIIYVYDITNKDSLNAIRDWDTFATKFGGNAIKFLVGNQCDLSRDRVISTEHGKKFAEDLNIPFFETSAKENLNVEAVFRSLTGMILENEWILQQVREKMRDTEIRRLSYIPTEEEGGKGCFNWIKNLFK